jgi:signal transduction histidine kinase
VTVVRDLTAEWVPAGGRREGVSRIASEIERPVAAVRAALELVPPVAGVRYGCYERIARRGVERLVGIAEDLRDRGLLEEGRLKLEKSVVRLEDLVATAAADLREEFLEKRIAFRGPDPDAEGLVLGDPLRLARSVARLLSAALRFAPDDGWVHVDLSPPAETCSLSIRFLQGPAMQEIEALLEPGAEGLYLGEGAMAVGAPGLAVIRQIVEFGGGRLSLKIEERQEARLLLELPAAPPPPGATQAAGAGHPLGHEFYLEP